MTMDEFVEGILRCKGPARAMDQVQWQTSATGWIRYVLPCKVGPKTSCKQEPTSPLVRLKIPQSFLGVIFPFITSILCGHGCAFLAGLYISVGEGNSEFIDENQQLEDESISFWATGMVYFLGLHLFFREGVCIYKMFRFAWFWWFPKKNKNTRRRESNMINKHQSKTTRWCRIPA